MEWETFTNRRPRIETPKVSIRKQGTLGISKVVYKKYLKDVEEVELLFSKKENKIGLRPLAEASEYSYPIRVKDPNIEISASFFLKHFGIPHETTTQYRASFQDGIVVADLNDRLN